MANIFGSTPLVPNTDTFSADPNRYLGDWTFGNFDFSKLTPQERQLITEWASGGWSPNAALGTGMGNIPQQQLHEGQMGAIYRLLGPERAAQLGITPDMVQQSYDQNYALAQWNAEQNDNFFDAEDLAGVLGVAGAAFGMNALGNFAAGGAAGAGAGSAAPYKSVADAIAAGDYAAADAMAANMFNTGNTLATGMITPGVGAIELLGGASGAGGGSLLSGAGGLLASGGKLVAGLAGGLLGGAGSGGKEAGTTTTTQAPWSEQQPYLKDVWGEAQGLYNQNSPLYTQATHNMQSLLGGPMYNPTLGLTNPYLESAIGTAQDEVVRKATGAFNNANRASGSYGNSGLQEAFARELPKQLANISTSMRMQDYGNQQNLFENATNRSVAATGNANNFTWQPLQNYSNIVGSGNWGGSTSQPYYTNPTANVLGGIATGVGLYNTLWGK